MKHTETFTVRWHDTDLCRRLSPSGYLTLMQETANLQFERGGVPLDTLRDRDGLAFLLSRLSFDILAPVSAYETLTATTFTAGGHGFGFARGFELRRGCELVARGDSLWALVRLSDRSLVRTEDFPLSFGDEPPVPTQTPLRFRFPRGAAFETVGERRVGYADADCNLHMNNTKYPNMLCDFLPDPAHTRVAGMSLSYLREAALGDVLTVERAPAEGGYYFRAGHGGTVCLEALVRTQS